MPQHLPAPGAPRWEGGDGHMGGTATRREWTHHRRCSRGHGREGLALQPGAMEQEIWPAGGINTGRPPSAARERGGL